MSRWADERPYLGELDVPHGCKWAIGANRCLHAGQIRLSVIDHECSCTGYCVCKVFWLASKAKVMHAPWGMLSTHNLYECMLVGHNLACMQASWYAWWDSCLHGQACTSGLVEWRPVVWQSFAFVLLLLQFVSLELDEAMIISTLLQLVILIFAANEFVP